MNSYNILQIREIFHLEFLRWFSKKVKAQYYALKGGSNLRFFFGSFRYSEDMDLDAYGIEKDKLKDAAMQILKNATFQYGLKPYGIERVVPPDITKAKQTETTQRFKIHLITPAGEDLFTKVEFSRRGFKGEIAVQPVGDAVLRAYKMPPLLAPHYSLPSAIAQKVDAISARAVIQARDIFDLYILIPQFSYNKDNEIKLGAAKLAAAQENIFMVSFEQFRDAVVSYLVPEEQHIYSNKAIWDEIVLKVSNFIEELRKG